VTDKTSKAVEGCFAFLLGTVLIFPMALYGGWVGGHLWTWFVTPLFGTAAPSASMLAGLMLLVKYTISKQPPKDDRSPLESVISSHVFFLFLGAYILGIGYVLHRIAS
jgi:hypothetical protein